MREFEYRVAASVAEAVALAGQSHGPYRFLAGGTDLFLALEHGARRIERVIDLKGIPEMDRIAALPDGGYEFERIRSFNWSHTRPTPLTDVVPIK